MMTPLDTASDLSEELTIYTTNKRYSEINVILNEEGDFSFKCKISLEHTYYPGDPDVGDSYSFEVEKVEVDLQEVTDADGVAVEVTKTDCIKIEKLFQKNLRFEIHKEY